MSEIKRKVVPYEYNYICDSCNNGMMKSTGQSGPQGFEHKCMICGHIQDLKKSYPHVEYFGEEEQPSS